MSERFFHDFLNYDLKQNSEEIDTLVKDEKNFDSILFNIVKELSQLTEKSRKNVNRISDVILDGNVSANGCSNSKGLSELQDKANKIVSKLCEEKSLSSLSPKVVNSILAGSITVLDPSETYYQSVSIKEDGTSVRRNIYNVLLHPYYLFSLVKESFLIAKSYVDKDLFTFTWAVLELIVDAYKVSEIKIDEKTTSILLYLAALSPIDENELVNKVESEFLKFNNLQKISVKLKEDDVHNIINNLYKLHVINIIEGKIVITEKIYL